MKITDLDQVPKRVMEMEGAKDTYKQLPIGSDDGAPLFSFRVFTIEPGGHTPYHAHPFEHVNYVIEGRGVLVTKTGEERALEKGSFCLVHPNETHQYKNTSQNKPMVMICAVPKEYE